MAVAGVDGGAFSATKRHSYSVADVADADGVFVDAKKDEVVSERHHPPIPDERVSRESLWQEIQRLARIEQPVEVAIAVSRLRDSSMM